MQANNKLKTWRALYAALESGDANAIRHCSRVIYDAVSKQQRLPAGFFILLKQLLNFHNSDFKGRKGRPKKPVKFGLNPIIIKSLYQAMQVGKIPPETVAYWVLWDRHHESKKQTTEALSRINLAAVTLVNNLEKKAFETLEQTERRVILPIGALGRMLREELEANYGPCLITENTGKLISQGVSNQAACSILAQRWECSARTIQTICQD